MNIEYLRFFYEVASVKSISKVANNSHISQPALSQQIHKLEDNLGYKLLDRSNKGVQLTEAGKIVEKYAKNILKVYENMLVDLNDISNNNKAIRIDAFPTMATYALPCTIYMIKENWRISVRRRMSLTFSWSVSATRRRSISSLHLSM